MLKAEQIGARLNNLSNDSVGFCWRGKRTEGSLVEKALEMHITEIPINRFGVPGEVITAYSGGYKSLCRKIPGMTWYLKLTDDVRFDVWTFP